MFRTLVFICTNPSEAPHNFSAVSATLLSTKCLFLSTLIILSLLRQSMWPITDTIVEDTAAKSL